MSLENQKVCVVGAGLVGCLTLLAFKKRGGYDVTMLEYRQDPRDDLTVDRNLRSINLAISDRGFRALKYVDPQLLDKVLDKVIPMHGRMIHDLEGNEESQLYGLYGESINSIDRGYLNRVLLDEIDQVGGIEVLFGHKLIDLSFNDTPKVTTEKGGEKTQMTFDFVVGTDGLFSATRHHLQKRVRMNFTQEYIDTCYVELYIPPGPNGSFLLDPNHLHIWPRKQFMLIALLNKDGSFTSTFFAPWLLLESLNTDDVVVNFFRTHFKDALPLIGEQSLTRLFRENPKGSLLQIHCDPYHFEDKAILLGDAAHLMVPFYGQGMNCGFESLKVLMESLDKFDDDRKAAFEDYSKTRHKDLELILELLLSNYNEMSNKVTSALYLMRKSIDGFLSRILKDKWLPLYTMVSFRGDISYSRLIETERRQQRILKKLQFILLIGGAIGSVRAYKFIMRFLRR